jgi:hypothetical protein
LPLRGWARDTLLLLAAASLGGVAALALARGVSWPAGLIGRLLETGLGCGLAFALYGLVASALGVPEARQMLHQLRRRLPGAG